MTSAAQTRTSRVKTTDGIELAVTERGEAAKPTIVAIHGYPDNSSVWDGVAEHLTDRFRVVTYDVRGCGASDKPTRRRDYKMAQLSADLRSVLDAVSPDEPVHLLAHDWGSIQTWASVTDPSFADRLLSYTSISGPSLDMAGVWIRSQVRPDREKLGKVTYQLAESFYVAAFQIPVIPEVLWRTGAVDKLMDRLERLRRSEGEVVADVPRELPDGLHGLELYRANMLPHLLRPKPQPTTVPVLVIAPTKDAYVSAPLQLEAPIPYVPDLQTATIDGGHWVVAEQPERIAELTTEFIDSL